MQYYDFFKHNTGTIGWMHLTVIFLSQIPSLRTYIFQTWRGKNEKPLRSHPSNYIWILCIAIHTRWERVQDWIGACTLFDPCCSTQPVGTWRWKATLDPGDRVAISPRHDKLSIKINPVNRARWGWSGGGSWCFAASSAKRASSPVLCHPFNILTNFIN